MRPSSSASSGVLQRALVKRPSSSGLLQHQTSAIRASSCGLLHETQQSPATRSSSQLHQSSALRPSSSSPLLSVAQERALYHRQQQQSPPNRGLNSRSSISTRLSAMSAVSGMSGVSLSPTQEAEARELELRLSQRAVMLHKMHAKREAAQSRAIARKDPFWVARDRAEKHAAAVAQLAAGARTAEITFLPRLPEAAEIAKVTWGFDECVEPPRDASEARRLVSGLSDDLSLLSMAAVSRAPAVAARPAHMRPHSCAMRAHTVQRAPSAPAAPGAAAALALLSCGGACARWQSAFSRPGMGKQFKGKLTGNAHKGRGLAPQSKNFKRVAMQQLNNEPDDEP
jgi:hypothetical protein